MNVALKDGDFMFQKMRDIDSSAAACAALPGRPASVCQAAPDAQCLRRALCENRALYSQLREAGPGAQRHADAVTAQKAVRVSIGAMVLCSAFVLISI